MVAKGKGKDYYKSTYTHEQLWDMLQVGDDWRVEQAGSIWTTAASGMKAAREEMAVHVTTLRTQWTGAASDEFQGRMSIVEEYSIESENGMKRTGEVTMPDLAGYLRSAQTDAQGADLYPSSTETYDEWLESQDIDKTKPEYETKKVQYQQQYEQYLDQRHETMAQIVADLGDRYARVREEDFAEPPPPSDMPGNTTYQAPTGGVFADSGLSNSNDVPDAPGGSDSSVSGDTSGADGIVGTDDDLDPVDSDWTPARTTTSTTAVSPAAAAWSPAAVAATSAAWAAAQEPRASAGPASPVRARACSVRRAAPRPSAAARATLPAAARAARALPARAPLPVRAVAVRAADAAA
nr:hypothetical protein GCM10025732_58980 [Glycomyces mayteni]